MPRSLWTGSLSFGLVNVPVALYSGVVDADLHFRQLHAKDHTPIEMHRYCAEEDAEVPYEEIANGYETDDGDLVILTDAELATAAPRKTRTITVRSRLWKTQRATPARSDFCSAACSSAYASRPLSWAPR